MKKLLLLTLLIVGFKTYAQKENTYPKAPKADIRDEYFGVKIDDPYQWMEDPNDPRLVGWLDAQKSIQKKQSNKQVRVWELRSQIASMYYGTKRKGTGEALDEEEGQKDKYEFKKKWVRYDRAPDLLYKLSDAKKFQYLLRIKDFQNDKDDNVFVSVKSVNEEEDLALITISRNGSDWLSGYLFDLKTGKQLPDTLKYLRVSSNIEWHGKNLYYDRYDAPKPGRELLDKAVGQKLYYHKYGKPQSEDKMMFQNIDITGTNRFIFEGVEGDRLMLYHYYKVRGQILKALSVANQDSSSFFLKNFLIYPNADSISINVELIVGDSVFLKTNWNAPNNKVLLANIGQPNKLQEFVPEYDINLREVNKLGKGKVACIYKDKGRNIAMIYNMKGEMLKKIDFPEGKRLNHFYEYDDDVSHTNFSVSSFFHPPLWYQISLDDLEFTPVQSVSVPYDPKSLETRLVNYPSKDGTEIPMYVTCRKDIKLDGTNPTLIYGYGGYGVVVEPSFDESLGLWLLHGGVLAVPNIRGGGEKGGKWAKEGRRLKKQNAIDDFIAAAEYLIKEKYTSSEKLAINGASHGGMLVAAAITQKPELFKAAIAEAGVYDMVRFEKYTAGGVSTNINEFGTTENQDDFHNLKAYSPMHNVKSGVKYPNILLITGDNDDRVPPLHTYKFLATLQEKGDPKGLYHSYITAGAGHGGALTVEDWVNEMLFKYYFLFDQLDVDFY